MLRKQDFCRALSPEVRPLQFFQDSSLACSHHALDEKNGHAYVPPLASSRMIPVRLLHAGQVTINCPKVGTAARHDKKMPELMEPENMRHKFWPLCSIEDRPHGIE